MALPFRCVLLALLVIGLTGCPPSLSPVHSDETLVYDEGLIGGWGGVEGEGPEWLFEYRDETSYFLYMEGESDPIKLVAHLADVGAYRYVNMYAEYPDVEFGAPEFFLPLNCFFRVDRQEDRLYLSVIDLEWLEKGLKSGPLELRHFTLKDDNFPIITADTEELQTFLIRYENHPALWEETEEDEFWVRKEGDRSAI